MTLSPVPVTMHIVCEQLLYLENGLPVMYCSQQRWTEHAHDYGPLEAMSLGLAVRLTDEVYGPPCPHHYQSDDELGLSVCDVCGAPADKPQHNDGS